MKISDPMYRMAEDDIEVVEEFFINEIGMALLPMHNGEAEMVSFTVIGCMYGDVTIIYNDGKTEERELSMSVEELTTAVSDA